MIMELMFPLGKKGASTMNAKAELISFISTLSEEQIDKIIDQLPQLTSLLGEASPPYPREQTLQNP